MPSNVRERENLNSSIQNSFSRRQAVDPDLPKDAVPSELQQPSDGGHQHNGQNNDGNGIVKERNNNAGLTLSTRNLSEPPRDPRDHATTPVPSRPASPYTLNPPIDFDGLSWPSEF